MGSTGIHVTLAEVDERAAIATNRLVNRFNQDVAAIGRLTPSTNYRLKVETLTMKHKE